MDLVDIDKVLDDFEFHENNDANAEKKRQESTADMKTVTSVRATGEPSSYQRINDIPRQQKNCFVNISKVFNSLDEYVNADINPGAVLRLPEQEILVRAEVRTASLTDTESSSSTTSAVLSDPEQSTTESTSSITYASDPSVETETARSPDSSSEREKLQKLLADEEITQNFAEGLSSVSSCILHETTSAVSSAAPIVCTNSASLLADHLSTLDTTSSLITGKDFKPNKENENLPPEMRKDERSTAANNARQVVQKTIGFCATMDDISDTELDSILQELDNAIANDNSESRNETGIYLVAGGDVMEILGPSETSSVEEIDQNQPNADSFSQASTVEFSELRLHNDFDSTSDHQAVATKPKSKLQRPNSLDLPVIGGAVSTSATITSSNAGQTPPATKLHCEELQSATIDSTSETDASLGAAETLHTDGEDPNDESHESKSKETSPSSTDALEWQQQQDTTPTTGHKISDQVGKVAPFWIPDSQAPNCMQCQLKFSLIKRRHHCRACGQVLCSQCCSRKFKLEYFGEQEARICIQCHLILTQPQTAAISVVGSGQVDGSAMERTRSPNPNNPMEYCSTVPPHQQMTSAAVGTLSSSERANSNAISVMVPVGVLKREGVPSKNPRKDKGVIFSDGIRPGCDLTELDNGWDQSKKSASSPASALPSIKGSRVPTPIASTTDSIGIMPALSASLSGFFGFSSNEKNSDSKTNTAAPEEAPSRSKSQPNHPVPEIVSLSGYIPEEADQLPPILVRSNKLEAQLLSVHNDVKLMQRLRTETLQFAVQKNFFVLVKIVRLKCCINKTVINFTTKGLHHVGQDELIILLEMVDETEPSLPKDLFMHLNEIYCNADRGKPITELGFSIPASDARNFLGSNDHGGFLYIRSTFQCLQEIILPECPFLIGVLMHRLELPWAKIFPLRLMLRLGAQYRYYPSPHVSIRGRDSVYAEIAQTIINFLADFRNYTYTLATIRGMCIHMEDRRTSVLLPKNRYDQVLQAVNSSSEHILALAGNFSRQADGHLVCIQNMEADSADTMTYTTQAINIQGKPRKVTGASFIVLNGTLKTTAGLSGKCSIVEDGLMVQIRPNQMVQVHNALRNMQDIEITCGPIDADQQQTEVVSLQWTENDVDFNVGVKSPIDAKKLNGIPSIRVHSGLNYANSNHVIRWTEVFILQAEVEKPHVKDPIDISKLSEKIAKSTSVALLSLLDLLAANECLKLGLRVTLHPDNVCYEAGSRHCKLPPIYMNALDNELIPLLHRQIIDLEIDSSIVLEMFFHILDK